MLNSNGHITVKSKLKLNRFTFFFIFISFRLDPLRPFSKIINPFDFAACFAVLLYSPDDYSFIFIYACIIPVTKPCLVLFETFKIYAR